MDRAARRRAARGNAQKIAGVWISNAPFAQTGYGTQTAQAVGRIIKDGHPFVVACNYGIEATTTEWEGIPLWPKGYDAYSNDVAAAYFRDWTRQHPGATPYLFTLFDTWTFINPNLDAIPIASWVPIDHMPVPPQVLAWCRKPNVTPIAMAQFGQEQLQRKDVPCEYVPHAIETSVMKPTASVLQDNGKRLTGRQVMGLPDDAFVVTIMNANKGVPSRKAFGEQVLAFSIFAERHPDAMLFVHSEQYGGAGGIQFDPLIAACGLDASRVKFVNQYQLRIGIPAEAIACILTASDVLLCPTYGEGFGLTALDAQAVGTPVITSDFTAQQELAGPDALVVSGQPWWEATQHAWWQIPSVPQMVDALEESYRRGHHRSQAAIDWVAEHYDADVVFDRHWRPVLERLAAGPAVPAVEPAAFDNGQRTKPTITIYIPTKGRAELAALLDSLAPQLTPEVEVIVSDNTGDAARPVRERLANAPCRVDYSRRSSDIGGDANIVRGFSQGSAPWVWMIGDDDVITEDGISRVLEAVRGAQSSGVDRLILLSKSAPKSAAGATGSLADLARIDPALPIAATLITANVVRRAACDPALGLANLDTKYGHAFAWPTGPARVLPEPVIERVGYAHAGEGIPDGWDGAAVKAEYLQRVGIKPGPESFAWNYMSAEAAWQSPTGTAA
jgi:glycosyltransferase involved in cell wall biosynthesis